MKLLWVLSFGVSFSACAESLLVRLSSKDRIPQNRLIFEIEDAKSKTAPILIQSRLAFRKDNYVDCYKWTEQALDKEPLLRPWLIAQALDCAIGETQDSHNGTDHLVRAIAQVNGHVDWFLSGSYASTLRNLFIQGHLLLAQKSLRDNRTVSHTSIQTLLGYKNWLSHDQLAETYKIAGELAFLIQHWLQAQDFFYRSLDVKDSDDVRQRIDGLRKMIPDEKTVVSSRGSLLSDHAVNVEATGEEQDLYQRMQKELGIGDLAAAVEDGAQMIEKFPGGRRARWAQDRIQDCYFTAAAKNKLENILFHQRILKAMLRADGGRLYDWAATLFQRGYYGDAQLMAEKSYSLMHGHPDSTKILRLAARAALLIGDVSTASRDFEILEREHAGTLEAVEAVFRLGLIQYRKKSWSESMAKFERVLALPGSEEFQYQALYWYWRAQQKLQPDQAVKTAEQIIKRFPLTYYGLRVRAEINHQTLQFIDDKKSEILKAEIYLTDPEMLSFKRLLRLLNLGWYREAQEELKDLPRGRTPLQKLLMSRYFSAALDDVTAFPLMNQAFDEDSSLLRADVLSWAFPREFRKFTQTEAKRSALDENLIVALIRQESSFKIEAASSASAVGLMQVLLPTAKEIAVDLNLKVKFENSKPLFDPATNIRIGCVYLSRLLKTFKGHLPLALAAYNVGIGRLRKFIAARAELANIESAGSSPDDELWIDEMPWTETSYYVKAVLRNYLIYQWLEKGEWVVPNPIWKSP